MDLWKLNTKAVTALANQCVNAQLNPTVVVPAGNNRSN